MVKKWFIFIGTAILIFLASLLYSPAEIYAQQGCCSWHGGISYCDTSVGTYVCNDGTYSPTCGCSYIPAYNPPPTFPQIKASWTTVANPSPNKTYNVSVDLKDSTPTQYSAVLSKCKGCDPGPLTDFYTNKFNYKDVASGTWYLNVKKSIGGRWSTVSYWTITIPAWVAPTPTPTPAVTATTSSDPTILGGTILLLFLIGGFWLGVYLLYKFVLWFKNYSMDNDWVWIILIFGSLWLLGMIVSSPNKTAISDINYGYDAEDSCDCSLTCPELTCDEAYFQLEECGCYERDGDDDGIPCEAQCL